MLTDLTNQLHVTVAPTLLSHAPWKVRLGWPPVLMWISSSSLNRICHSHRRRVSLSRYIASPICL